MPEDAAPASIGQQLAHALRTTEVSARELGRRLAEEDGADPEIKRRWVQKVLADDLRRPNMAAVERALGLEPGYFVLASRVDELASRRSLMQRVERLEADVDDLTTALEAAKQAHAKLLRRVAAIEKAAVPAQGARQAAGSSRRARSGG